MVSHPTSILGLHLFLQNTRFSQTPIFPIDLHFVGGWSHPQIQKVKPDRSDRRLNLLHKCGLWGLSSHAQSDRKGRSNAL